MEPIDLLHSKTERDISSLICQDSIKILSSQLCDVIHTLLGELMSLKLAGNRSGDVFQANYGTCILVIVF